VVSVIELRGCEKEEEKYIRKEIKKMTRITEL